MLKLCSVVLEGLLAVPGDFQQCALALLTGAVVHFLTQPPPLLPPAPEWASNHPTAPLLVAEQPPLPAAKAKHVV